MRNGSLAIIANILGFSMGWWGAESWRAFNGKSHFDWANTTSHGFIFASVSVGCLMLAILVTYFQMRSSNV